MPRKPRPVHSPAGSFAPCFAPLDEDPSSRSLEGWIADEDEHTQLAQTLEDEGKVVLVLGSEYLGMLAIRGLVIARPRLMEPVDLRAEEEE